MTVVGRQEYAWWRARTTDQRRYCYSHKRRLESHTREKRNDLHLPKPTSDCRCGAEMVAECVLI